MKGTTVGRIGALLALAFAILPGRPGLAHADEAVRTGIMYKNPGCECCEGHARYLRMHGYDLQVIETESLADLRQAQGVPESLEGCHMILIDGYVVEGHVPASALERLLVERPTIKGISLPGMPQGSPGMSGKKEAPFEVLEISDGTPKIFAVE
jgi:hypothetical protein